MAALISLGGNKANAFEVGGHQSGYCWDNKGTVWVACNFPNGRTAYLPGCKDSKLGSQKVA